MSSVLITFGVIVLLAMFGGFFAAAETSLVSLRESQVRSLAETHGRRGRRLADLNHDPNRWLAAVQVGVTVAGFLSAGFGAERITPKITPHLEKWGIPHNVAAPSAFFGTTLLIAFIVLVLGELAPKRLALQRSATIALATAGVVDGLARITRPFIWLLSITTDVVVRLLGGDPKAGKGRISEDELRGMVATHGELSEDERTLIDDVFDAGEREIVEIMVPRTEVDFLSGGMPAFKAIRIVSDGSHSRYPVMRDSADDVIGFVHIRDLLNPDIADRSIRVAELAREVAFLPASKHVIPALSEMRRTGAHLAIVVDEYGGTAGIVTLEDLVEELVGEIRDEYDEASVEPRRTPGGSVEVDGLLNLTDLSDDIGIELPEGPYETVAGYIANELGRLAEVGDEVGYPQGLITVVELDGRRIARARFTPVPHPVADTDAEGVEG
jgi:putative hemolysin